MGVCIFLLSVYYKEMISGPCSYDQGHLTHRLLIEKNAVYLTGAIRLNMVQFSCDNRSESNQILADFNDPRCSYAFFNRHGGKGRAPYAAKNVSFGVGDEFDIVRKNRELVKRYIQVDHLVSARQVHGDAIYCHLGDSSTTGEIEGVDALITERPGIGLMVQQADCQAILLFDPCRPAVGAIHCGWRGSVAGIIGKTVAEMTKCFGSDPEYLRAAVSPSLGPCCGEFINYKKELPAEFLRFQVKDNYFDFWQITKWQLQECGINELSITIAGMCTVCSPDFFSYRRSCRKGSGPTGRNCSVIALRKIELR
jgi:polyphenol oxidase